jgi:hypothetical protein
VWGHGARMGGDGGTLACPPPRSSDPRAFARCACAPRESRRRRRSTSSLGSTRGPLASLANSSKS